MVAVIPNHPHVIFDDMPDKCQQHFGHSEIHFEH